MSIRKQSHKQQWEKYTKLQEKWAFKRLRKKRKLEAVSKNYAEH